MPTRATAIHAGGSLAGKVSIRLSTSFSSSRLSTISFSSTDAVVLSFRKGPTFAVPLRLRCRDAFGVIDLGGPSDHGRADQLMLSRPELEGEDDKGDAKSDRVGSEPPGQHDSANQRCDDKECAISNGQ
jgi:hypothetical protein